MAICCPGGSAPSCPKIVSMSSHSNHKVVPKSQGCTKDFSRLSQQDLEGFQWDSCSPRCTGDLSCWLKSRFQNKNWLSASNIQFLGSKLHILSLATNLSRTGQCFQHKRGVSLVPWYKGTEVVLHTPQNNGFMAQNGQILPQTIIFGQISAFLAHLIQCLTKKQLEQHA